MDNTKMYKCLKALKCFILKSGKISSQVVVNNVKLSKKCQVE